MASKTPMRNPHGGNYRKQWLVITILSILRLLKSNSLSIFDKKSTHAEILI